MDGSLVDPCRARPVPFCRYGFAAPPETRARGFVDAVPWRALAIWRTKAWCITGVFSFSAKMTLGSLTSPLRAPAESKRGASRWSASLRGVVAFFVAVFVAVFLAVFVAVFVAVLRSAIRRG